MTVLQQLKRASFRGFEFIERSESNSSGKKVVVHEYPNSSKRYVEELGTRPATFSINALVHGDIQRRYRFEQLLKQPGLGTLVHSVYGTIDVMAGEYTVSSNQNNIGEFLFTITFYVSESNITPTVEEDTQSTVLSKVDSVRASTTSALKTTYTIPTSADSFSDAEEKVTAILDLHSDNFNLDISAINVSELIHDPESLGDTLSSLFVASATSATALDAAYSLWDNFISFGDDDTTIQNTTVKRQEIIDNRTTLNDYIKINSLAQKYETSVLADYATEEQLLSVKQEMNNYYDGIMLDSITPTKLYRSKVIVLDSAIRSDMASLRDSVREVYNALLQSIWRVITIQQHRSTPLLTTFQYFGDIDNVDIILDLNKGIPSSGFSGDIKSVST